MMYLKKTPFSKILSRRRFLRYSAQVGLAAGLHLTTGCTSRKTSGDDLPNIVLISLDTTRAKNLSCYGHTRNTSRNLDILAEESVFCTRAITTSSWTLPAHASMFTGMFVTSHGARMHEAGKHTLDKVFEYGGDYRIHVRSIAEDQEVLAEILGRVGYATGAVVAGPWLKKNFGLAKGFDYHDDEGILGIRGSQKKIAPFVTGNAIKWLQSIQGKRFFLFLNYFDPHTPYIHMRDTRNLFLVEGENLSHEDQVRRDYDIQIYIMDHSIGRLIEHLKSTGSYDNTFIMVVGDHGELLNEHGLNGHGTHLYQETMHVPFFFKYPQGEVAHRTHAPWTQVTDVMPLILERLNLPIPDYVQGRTLDGPEHPILAEAYPPEHDSEFGYWQALYEGQHKILLNSKGSHQLFDLKSDPHEMKNLYSEDAERAQRMTRKLQTLLSEMPRPEGSPVPLEFDDQTREELEALGYLQ